MRRNWNAILAEFESTDIDFTSFCRKKGIRASDLRAAQKRLKKKSSGFVQVGGTYTIKLEIQSDGAVNVLDLPASSLPKILNALSDAVH